MTFVVVLKSTVGPDRRQIHSCSNLSVETLIVTCTRKSNISAADALIPNLNLSSSSTLASASMTQAVTLNFALADNIFDRLNLSSRSTNLICSAESALK